jgi:hypothetical protein
MDSDAFFGLEGDLLNDFDDLGRFGSALLDVANGAGHLVHRLIALVGGLLGFPGDGAGLLGALGILLGHRAHHFHGRAGFFQGRRLFAIQLTIIVGIVSGTLPQRHRAGSDITLGSARDCCKAPEMGQ